MKTKKEILLIGGYDPSGGAGLAMDLRVCRAQNIPAQTITTCLALQTNHSFLRLENLQPEQILAQLSAPHLQTFGSMKIGALGSLAPWHILKKKLTRSKIPLVLDPVYQSSSGGFLLNAKKNEIRELYLEHLAPCATIFTPNYLEACFLLDIRAANKPDPHALVEHLAKKIHCAILLKGGHSQTKNGQITDLLFHKGTIFYFLHKRHLKRKVRGTGCALATALACHLSLQMDLRLATQTAIAQIASWIASAQVIGPDIFHLLP